MLFQEPFDAYLYYLLSISSTLTVPFDHSLEQKVPELTKNSPASATRWTLWVPRDVRVQFDDRKLVLCPAKSHGGFVEMLLVYRNFLAASGTLPPFSKDSISFLSSPSSSPAFDFSSIEDNMYGSGYGISESTLSAQPIFSAYGELQSHLSKKPRRTTLTIKTKKASKKSRYSYSSQAPVSANDAFYSSPVTNLNNDLNNLYFSPNTPADNTSYPSPDILEAAFIQLPPFDAFPSFADQFSAPFNPYYFGENPFEFGSY